MLMVPFITIILAARGVEPDLAVKMAIATSMATIIFTSISSVRAHHQHGFVRWNLGVIAACSVLTAPLGARAAHKLPVKQLKRVFATILYVLAAYMLYKVLTIL